MPALPATDALLAGFASATSPSYALNEALMLFPDYAVAALVGGIELARRFGAPAAYSVGVRAATPIAMHWPASLGASVRCPDLVLGPAPVRDTDEQVVNVASVDELDRLTKALLERYGGRSPLTMDAMFWLLQVAGRNALRWSVDQAACIGWAERGHYFELAVGDSGLGIPVTSRAGSATRPALQELTERYDERGRPSNGLTRLLEHWRFEVHHVEGYILSGDELFAYQRYNQVFRRAKTAGPTVICAAF